MGRGVLVCHRLQGGIRQLCSRDLVSLTSLVLSFLFLDFFFFGEEMEENEKNLVFC